MRKLGITSERRSDADAIMISFALGLGFRMVR
jgi:hypothetical protein